MLVLQEWRGTERDVDREGGREGETEREDSNKPVLLL